MKNIRVFYLKIFIFLVVKFTVYLNRHVFVIVTSTHCKCRYPRNATIMNHSPPEAPKEGEMRNIQFVTGD